MGHLDIPATRESVLGAGGFRYQAVSSENGQGPSRSNNTNGHAHTTHSVPNACCEVGSSFVLFLIQQFIVVWGKKIDWRGMEKGDTHIGGQITACNCQLFGSDQLSWGHDMVTQSMFNECIHHSHVRKHGPCEFREGTCRNHDIYVYICGKCRSIVFMMRKRV